jgi:hypothetical protein
VGKPVHFKRAGLLITAMLCAGSLGFAQEAKPPLKTQVPIGTEKDLVSTQGEKTEPEEDESTETDNLNLVKAKLLRAHMDASGHVRPELRNAGVAQLKRVKVATHIGPIPKEPRAQSKYHKGGGSY